MKTSHRLRILGRELQVKSSASVESVREIEAYLNEMAAEVTQALPNADQQLVSLLMLLNITESYLALRGGKSLDATRLQHTVDHIVAKIDTALGA